MNTRVILNEVKNLKMFRFAQHDISVSICVICILLCVLCGKMTFSTVLLTRAEYTLHGRWCHAELDSASIDPETSSG